MSSVGNNSVFKGVDVHTMSNHFSHHTSELPLDQLIVRRGQSFKVTLNLTKPFKKGVDSLTLVASTGGKHASEENGTSCRFGIPDPTGGRSSAKAVWKATLDSGSTSSSLAVLITPPPDAPVGKYTLNGLLWGEDKTLATFMLLFNPWFSGDAVFMSDEQERREYVLNEHGVIFRGSSDYISPLTWDYGHFEDDMVDICLHILDNNVKYKKDPGSDLAARCDPAYVGRVVSAMVNNFDDSGVLMGNWSDSYAGGYSPSHWSGSHDILSKWKKSGSPVKYGQCWVFAGVMCSVMRLLGVPTRVITNFASAHDTDANLTIDVYHADEGAEHRDSDDSIWNYHVWVESWMKRPDLKAGGKFDGWQVLDATPQELSDGLYQCGPASVSAVFRGETDMPYDVPFVFAEVNADCVDWLIKADGTKEAMKSYTKRVGKKISTKAVGSDERVTITNSYKHKEGSEEERAVFNYAISDDKENAVGGSATDGTPPPQLSLQFEEVSQPKYGQDVQLKLVLSSESKVDRNLSIHITVEALRYNGTFVATVHTQVKEETLKPSTELTVPINIPVKSYYKHMRQADSLNVAAILSDKRHPEIPYLAEDNVVLQDPPVIINVDGDAKKNGKIFIEVVFMNPLQETLTDVKLTLVGTGVFREEVELSLPNLKPNNRIRIKMQATPYKAGKKTIIADISSSIFKDFKGFADINIRPA
ncbi:protein-glutamine gamma-glutamyltransferase E [Corythoichthys intestinalis]|uniref:protein-glutamine gamma-glutamyltransferase E n=1 Tax=Corythoichthys intestinalis TaxID=161448 RepID=UPI0025A4F725|nr:protein-glutamine gamma-glutamyltransferase E [Corythoichthys intestinalis]